MVASEVERTKVGLSEGIPQCWRPALPLGSQVQGQEADLDVKQPDFQAVCVSGKLLSCQLFPLMMSD